jgi:hypothetical protein
VSFRHELYLVLISSHEKKLINQYLFAPLHGQRLKARSWFSTSILCFSVYRVTEEGNNAQNIQKLLVIKFILGLCLYMKHIHKKMMGCTTQHLHTQDLSGAPDCQISLVSASLHFCRKGHTINFTIWSKQLMNKGGYFEFDVSCLRAS